MLLSDAGPFFADVAAQQTTAWCQSPSDAQSRISGERSDFYREFDLQNRGEQGHEHSLVGSDLHAGETLCLFVGCRDQGSLDFIWLGRMSRGVSNDVCGHGTVS